MNIFNIIKDKLLQKPASIPSVQVKDLMTRSQDADLFKKLGVVATDLNKILQTYLLINQDRVSIYRAIDTSLVHPIMSGAAAAYADYACLVGDTKIPLLDGRILEIKDILAEFNEGKQLEVYSCDSVGSPKAEKISYAIEQPNKAQVLRIWLDNEKYVDASINHRFIKRNGDICRADELVVGDSLMPFHRSKSHVGSYEMVWDVFKGVWESTYKMVVRTVLGVDTNVVNESIEDKNNKLVIHHIDFNKNNNSISNLKLMKCLEHLLLHNKGVPISEESKQNISRGVSQHLNNRWSKITSEERSEFAKKNIEKRRTNGTIDRLDLRLPVEKVECPTCKNIFERKVDGWWKQMFCSAECSYKVNSMNVESLYTRFIKGEGAKDLGKEVGVTHGQIYRAFKKYIPSYNHKITKIESLGEQVVYDISVTGNHLFGLDCGIYVHNTTRSPLHNKTVWGISENREYEQQLNKFLDIINIEEKIYDWAWSIATYGDFFVRVEAQPGIGIVSINDDDHPINISRVDYRGRLIGFYETPSGSIMGSVNTAKLIAPYEFCLRGNTKINLLDNTQPTIKEIVENKDKYIGKKLWSVNSETQELEIDEIEDAIKTKENTDLVRVWLDDVSYIDCTPEHMLMLRDGSYKEAQNLIEGESLMPFYTKVCKHRGFEGYELVYNPGLGKWHYTHKFVSRLVNGKTPKNYVVHHKDLHKLNNEPENLVLMEKQEHIKFHGSLRKGKVAWNKGLTKETDIRIAKTVEKVRLTRELKNILNPVTEEMLTCKCHGLLFKSKVTLSSHVTYFNNREKFLLESKINRLANIEKDKEYHKQYDLNHKEEKKEYWLRKKEWILNHKVVKVEKLQEREDVYDLTIKKNHNFAVNSSVFVHNCHFRLLGAKKRRPVGGQDPSWSEYNTISLLSPDQRRISSQYGTSILNDALPIFKRLRLCEDSLMMARINKGVSRYLYKVGIGEGTNTPEAVASIIEEYVVELKRARAFDSGANSTNYNDRSNFMNALEDIIVPVFGGPDQLGVEKIGGETDIKWITDVTELRNQLFCALRVPPQLLGGFQEELPSSLGTSSLERMSISFARQTRRIQRALISGLTRMFQIHLAYQGINPDIKLFEIHLASTSSAEEEELATTLDKNADAVTKLTELMSEQIGVDFDKKKWFEYVNQKFLKLNDFEIDDYILKGNPAAFKPGLNPDEQLTAPPAETTPATNPFKESKKKNSESVFLNSDIKADLPKIIPAQMNDKKEVVKPAVALWESKFKGLKVKIKHHSESTK